MDNNTLEPMVIQETGEKLIIRTSEQLQPDSDVSPIAVPGNMESKTGKYNIKTIEEKVSGYLSKSQSKEFSKDRPVAH